MCLWYGSQQLVPAGMPVSMEQWRASVGSNNAARSHVLAKCVGKKSPKTLLGRFLLFLFALFSQGAGLVTNKGKTKAATIFYVDVDIT